MADSTRVEQAIHASEIIVTAADRAASALTLGNRPYNGFGVLYDPSLTYGALLDAKHEIDKALAAYRATRWPTRADYDDAET